MITRITGNIFIFFIRFYQLCISPLSAPSCRFYPTCSDYAITAIRHHGLLKGYSVPSDAFFVVTPSTPAVTIL